jgi:acyl-CoA thioester hydrolase
LGEILVTAVRVEKVGNTSFTFVLEITEEASGRVIAQGKETLVVVDVKTMRPVPVPEALRAAISQLDRQGVAQATA